MMIQWQLDIFFRGAGGMRRDEKGKLEGEFNGR